MADSAGQAALYLARAARHVTILVRGARSGHDVRLPRAEIDAAPNIDVACRREVVGGGGSEVLEHLVVRNRDTGAERRMDVAGLFLLIGSEPRTEWLADTVERTRGVSSAPGPTCPPA